MAVNLRFLDSAEESGIPGKYLGRCVNLILKAHNEFDGLDSYLNGNYFRSDIVDLAHQIHFLRLLKKFANIEGGVGLRGNNLPPLDSDMLPKTLRDLDYLRRYNDYYIFSEVWGCMGSRDDTCCHRKYAWHIEKKELKSYWKYSTEEDHFSIDTENINIYVGRID